MGGGLVETGLGLGLEELDGVSAGGEPRRRLLEAARWTSASASFAGSQPCLPFQGLPGGTLQWTATAQFHVLHQKRPEPVVSWALAWE